MQNFKHLDYSSRQAIEVEFILFNRDFESARIRRRLIDNWRRDTLGTFPFIPCLRVIVQSVGNALFPVLQDGTVSDAKPILLKALFFSGLLCNGYTSVKPMHVNTIIIVVAHPMNGRPIIAIGSPLIAPVLLNGKFLQHCIRLTNLRVQKPVRFLCPP